MNTCLPEDWIESTFGGLNQFASQTVDPSEHSDKEFELYSVPSFPTDNPERLLGGAIGSTKQSVAPGDVLVCKINPRVNRVWQVKPATNLKQIASSEWIGFRAPEMEPRFFLHYFRSPHFRELIRRNVTGVGGSLTRAQPKNVATFAVPVAPAREQSRIADQLDAMLARVNNCNDRFDGIPAILKRFRQAVLSVAMASQLADDMQETDQPFKSAKASIASVAQVGTGSTPLRSNLKFYANSGMPWVTSAATSQALVTGANEYVTPEAIAAHRLKVYPPGTLLVAMYGEGKTRGQVSELGIHATINQACAAIVVDEAKALKAYVKLALQGNYLVMRELAEGGNQPNLNLSKIKEFEIPLPALAEQTEIVRRIDSLFATADRLEARCTAAQAQVARLTPLLLAKAFRGELVPQDPADEPASELLARLCQRRAENSTGPSKRRGAKPGHARVARSASSA